MIATLDAPTLGTVFQFGNRERVRLSAREPTRTQMPVAAIAVFLRKVEREALRYVGGFVYAGRNKIDVLLSVAKVHIGCVAVNLYR